MDRLDAASLWAELAPNDRGLVATVVQHVHTGQVLMVAWMNEQALAATLDTGRTTFFSRSRHRLWEKGEDSGNRLLVRDLRIDCDGDVILVQAEPTGPACHTGATSCFFRRVEGDGGTTLVADDAPPAVAGTVLSRVFELVLQRKAGRGATNSEGRSYVKSLMDGGTPKVAAKILEEASELAEALDAEPDDRVSAEAADLIFHVLVALGHRGVSLDDVADVLRARLGRSGIDEKRSRESREDR